MNRRDWFAVVAISCTVFVCVGVVGCRDETPAPPRLAITSVSAAELMQLMNANADILVLDVRRPDEHAAGHIAGAVNIPHSEITDRLDDLAGYRDKHVIVCCWAGGRADIAKQVLREAGFTSLLDLRGHMAEWERLGYPVERGSK
jgi:rhodanese-related sulfurtransferase